MPPHFFTIMSLFDRAISDIFKCPDFLEGCIIDGLVYACICSALDENIIYSDAGRVDDEAFTLDLKLPLQKKPKIGSLVKFRGEDYKVSYIDTDSANASIKLHLQSTSKGA